MFAGDIVEFNVNFTYVVRVLYMATSSLVKSCSSAAISHRILLSAAHCLVEKGSDVVHPKNIRLTVIGPFANDMTFEAKNAFVHPQYEPNKANDICLIQAATRLPVNPVDVSWKPIVEEGTDCLGAGFGSRYIHPFQGRLAIPVLSWIRYPLGLMLPKSTCILLRTIANGNVICLLLFGGVGPCGGDSGGPMICNGVLHGLLSRGMILGGDNCGAARGILIYEEVHAYREWIDNVTRFSESNSNASRVLQTSNLFDLLPLVLYLALAYYTSQLNSLHTMYPIISSSHTF